jgi:hypothetical protein
MSRTLLAAATLAFLASLTCTARGATLVPVSQQYTVDSDGDGVADLLDNAPGATDPSQTDADNDAIGDIIDPTPLGSNPFLGDPLLVLGVTSPILAGSNANFDYQVLNTPPGGWGRIELDFDLDTNADAIYFGPLTNSLNTISIPASLFVGSSWDLNSPETYSVGMRVYAPGMWSQSWAQPFVHVLPVPEPSTSLLAGIAVACLSLSCRRRRPH